VSELSQKLTDDMTVYVREYQRFRYEKWETIVSHFRRWPRR
jgi:hypothetical protein